MKASPSRRHDSLAMAMEAPRAGPVASLSSFIEEDSPMRLLPALALSAALATGACTNPDGSMNVPGTVALGAGALLATAAIASANQPRRDSYYYAPPRRPYGYDRGYAYRQPYYGRPYAGGYAPRRYW